MYSVWNFMLYIYHNFEAAIIAEFVCKCSSRWARVYGFGKRCYLAGSAERTARPDPRRVSLSLTKRKPFFFR